MLQNTFLLNFHGKMYVTVFVENVAVSTKILSSTTVFKITKSAN